MARSTSRTGKQRRFSKIPGPQIQRSVLNRSCGHKTTLDAGYLVPFFADEVLPGDTMSMSVALFGRIATLLEPIMDNMFLDTHFFFVPNRLLWDNWQKFMGEQDNPDDSIDFQIPITIASKAGGYEIGSIQDHFGLPTGIDGVYPHSCLFLRAYNQIFNAWFRDQNLVNSVVENTGDGPDSHTNFKLLRRGKRHDYFTSCLPWPQKGGAVSLPLGGTAPVTLDAQSAFNITKQGDGRATYNIDGTNSGNLVASGLVPNQIEHTVSATAGFLDWNNPKLETDISGAIGTTDLSAATATTINSLREAFQIQRLMERDARGGTRYTEIIKSHFGINSPDARLQRPEYLGGGSQRINIQAVANTAGDDSGPSTINQGDLAAYGTVSGTGHSWRKSFTEHGVIIGLVSMRADLNYQQGLERMWSRLTRHDFYWPAFAHLGEQAVLNKEIMLQVDPVANDEVFGYQERHAEYRYKPSQITGLFRSTAPTSLDVWHVAQEFETLPVLDQEFIEEDPPIDRVIAVPSEPHLLLDSFFSYKCARPMPTYSVPGLIDHF